MTKKEEQKAKVKEQLVWRLSTKPNVDDVKSLLKDEVITKEEAREILFSVKQTEETEPLTLAGLEEEMKFLRGLILKLMDQGNTVQTIIKYVEQPHWRSYGFGPVWVNAVNNSLAGVPQNSVMTLTASGGFGGSTTYKVPETTTAFHHTAQSVNL